MKRLLLLILLASPLFGQINSIRRTNTDTLGAYVKKHITVADSVQFNKPLQSKYFSGQGFISNGWQIDSVGNVIFNNATIRGFMRVYEFIVNQIRATNGSVFITSTGKAGAVRDYGSSYYRVSTDSGGVHGFAKYDLIKAQRFTGTGTYVSCMRVDSVQNTEKYFATLISGVEPAPGYEYVRLGNTTNTTRMGSVYMTADDVGAPRIIIKAGVNSFGAFGSDSTTQCIIGNLGGITDPSFTGVDTVGGYGIYTRNGFFTGKVIASHGSLIKGDYIEANTLTVDKIYGGAVDSIWADTLGARVASLGQAIQLLTQVAYDSSGVGSLVALSEASITAASIARENIIASSVTTEAGARTTAVNGAISTATAAIAVEAGNRTSADGVLQASIDLKARKTYTDSATNRLDTSIASVRVTADSVRIMATKNGVIGYINVAPDSIKINAAHITIGSSTSYATGYDPLSKETTTGSQAKANAAQSTALAAVTVETSARRANIDSLAGATVSIRTAVYSTFNGRIDSTIGGLTVANTGINLRVSKNDVVNQVNLDSSGLQIAAHKVVFDIAEIPDSMIDTVVYDDESFGVIKARVDSVETSVVMESGKLQSTINRYASDSASRTSFQDLTESRQTATTLAFTAANLRVDTANRRIDTTYSSLAIRANGIDATVSAETQARLGRTLLDTAAISLLKIRADSIAMRVTQTTYDSWTGAANTRMSAIELTATNIISTVATKFDTSRVVQTATVISQHADTLIATATRDSARAYTFHTADSIRTVVATKKDSSFIVQTATKIAQQADTLIFTGQAIFRKINGDTTSTIIEGSKIRTTDITALGHIVGGTFNLGSGKFTVDSAGNMTANSLTLIRDTIHYRIDTTFNNLARKDTVINGTLTSFNTRIGQTESAITLIAAETTWTASKIASMKLTADGLATTVSSKANSSDLAGKLNVGAVYTELGNYRTWTDTKGFINDTLTTAGFLRTSDTSAMLGVYAKTGDVYTKSATIQAYINGDGSGVRINADKITIGGATTFATGYDPTGKTSSSDVTTIIGSTVTTSFINALNVTANTLVASASLTTPVINGTLKIGGSGGATLTFNAGVIQVSTGLEVTYGVGAQSVDTDLDINAGRDITAQGDIITIAGTVTAAAMTIGSTAVMAGDWSGKATASVGSVSYGATPSGCNVRAITINGTIYHFLTTD